MTDSPTSIQDQLKALAAVQEVDLQVEGLKKQVQGAPASLKKVEEARDRAKKAWDAKVLAIGELEKVQKQHQAALELNKDRLQRSTQRLEAVGNTQEYQAITRELEQLRRMATSLEEQASKANKDRDALAAEASTAETAFRASEEEWTKANGEMAASTEKAQSQLNALAQARLPLAAAVEPRLLSQYDRIRPARQGMGLAPANGGQCKACNRVLPPQQYNELQKGSGIHQCSSCHRLLFIPG